MKASEVITKAKANDEFLNELSVTWKSRTACKNNPVTDLFTSRSAFRKLLVIGVISAIWISLMFFRGLFFAIPTIITVMYGLIRVYEPAEEAFSNSEAFISALSTLEKNEPLTPFWGLSKYGEQDRLVIGRGILKPMAGEIKKLQKFAWNQKKVNELKARFTQTHTQLSSLGFANKNHAEYWQ